MSHLIAPPVASSKLRSNAHSLAASSLRRRLGKLHTRLTLDAVVCSGVGAGPASPTIRPTSRVDGGGGDGGGCVAEKYGMAPSYKQNEH